MHKSKKTPSPVVLQPGKTAASALALVGGVMCAIILLVSRSLPEMHPLYCLIVLVGFLPLILLALLIDAFRPVRITVSTEGIRLFVRRSKTNIDLPWTNFRHMYKLEGYKRCIYLFTAEPMGKEAQITCYKACCKNKTAPFTFEKNLILDAWSSGNVIDPRIPEHIEKMPWTLSAKL